LVDVESVGGAEVMLMVGAGSIVAVGGAVVVVAVTVGSVEVEVEVEVGGGLVSSVGSVGSDVGETGS
jgi:hypothetical protein